MVLVNIINNENLSHFSFLTTGKVSGLTICFETVKLMEYGIKEINREIKEIIWLTFLATDVKIV